MSTVKGSGLLTAPVKRGRVRKCKDCTDPNPPSEVHADSDYCPACIGAHTTRCTSCSTPFTRDGVNMLCVSCRGQLPLFGDPA